MPISKPPYIRLYENSKEMTNGCLEWQGQTGSSGYGQIKAFRKMVSCHRLSYELNYGPIPEGLEVMHSCHNKLCINPDHLSIGTHKQNMKDAAENKSWSHVKRVGVSGVNKSQSKQVEVLGKVYGSINEAERSLSVGSGTVGYWIKNAPWKARVITKLEYLEKVNV